MENGLIITPKGMRWVITHERGGLGCHRDEKGFVVRVLDSQGVVFGQEDRGEEFFVLTLGEEDCA